MIQTLDATLFGFGLLLLMLALVVAIAYRNMTPQMTFVFRVITALAVAMLAASIPGFFDLEWTGTGLVIRAGGAIGLFVLVYLVNPPARIAKRRGKGGP